MKGKFLSLLMLGVLSVPSVLAEQPWDTIRDILTLEFLNNIGISSTGESVEGFIRLLLLITLFAIFFGTLEKVEVGGKKLGFGKNINIVIALAISLISTVLIPGTLLLAVATSYTTIISVILLGLPVLVGLFIYFELTENPWLRIGILVPLILGMHAMISYIETAGTRGFFTFSTTLFTLVLIFMYILLIISVFRVFKPTASVEGAASTVSEKVGGILSKKKEAAEEKARRGEDAAKAEKRRKLLEPAKGFIVHVMTAADELYEALDDRSARALTTAKSAYDTIIENLRLARREIATARRRGDATGEKREYLLKLGAYTEDEANFTKENIKKNLPSNPTDPSWDRDVAAVQVALRELKGRCGYVLNSIDQFLEEDAIEFVSPHGRGGARS